MRIKGGVAVDCEGPRYQREDRDGRRTLVVSGEIDVATAPRLRHELRMLIAEAHSPAVVDLSRVTFLDATGLSALVGARNDVHGTDVSLVLLNPSPPTRRVLEITGLDSHFDVVDDWGAPS